MRVKNPIYSFTQHSDSSANEIKTSKSLTASSTSHRYNTSSSQAPQDSHIVTNSSIQSDSISETKTESIQTESKQTYSSESQTTEMQTKTATTKTTTDVGNALGQSCEITSDRPLNSNIPVSVAQIDFNGFHRPTGKK